MSRWNLWHGNYLNENGRPGGLLFEPGGGAEGNNEKGKLLGSGFCPPALTGGAPQSNDAGAGEGEPSPSGFFVDQADLAWCFVLRVPPLVLNGEGEVVGKVIGSGGTGVAVAPLVELKTSLPSFWGVFNSTRVLAVVEAFALRSGLSRALNKTFFNL